MNRTVVLAAAAFLLHGLAGLAQTPPPQPATGPGGLNYPFAAVSTRGPYWASNRTNNDSYKYYIYEPATPTPAQAPVILFLHGFAALAPNSYQAWINHLVRKGYTVVWAQYQASDLTFPTQYLPNAISAWSDALYRLQNFWWENHVAPVVSLAGQVETIIVGHSVGAWTAANIAATAKTSNPSVPIPYGLVLIEPGTKSLVPGKDFSNINPTTLLTMVVGDEDTVVCHKNALQIWNAVTQIPVAYKNLLLVQTDTHGTPQQIGNHYFPGTTGFMDTAAIDDRDYNITWKLSVAMAECAFNNATDPNACVIALGAGAAAQTTMGLWSDSQAVKPLVYYSDPNTLPAVPGCPANQ
jgi:hypothetical protein